MVVQAEMEWLECSSRVVSEGCPPGGVGISTFALGEIPVEPLHGADCIRPGDAVILSGAAGAHGAAVYAALKGVDASGVSDDTAPLNDLVHALVREEYGLRLMCYPEKGVRAAAGNITAGTPWRVEIDEAAVAVDQAVASFCSKNNLDPLALSTTGAMMAVVSERYEPEALAAIRRSAYGVNAAVIGRIA